MPSRCAYAREIILLSNQFLDFCLGSLCVSLAAAVLHYVADKRLDRLFLAVSEILNSLGVALNSRLAELKQRVFVHAAHVALADEFEHALAAVEHFLESRLGELVKLLDSGKIRNNLAKSTLEKMLDSGKGALEFISESDMGGVDDNALLELCQNAIAGNAKAVADFKGGKEKALKALVGNVMKNSRGKADAQAAEAKIKALILGE